MIWIFSRKNAKSAPEHPTEIATNNKNKAVESYKGYNVLKFFEKIKLLSYDSTSLLGLVSTKGFENKN